MIIDQTDLDAVAAQLGRPPRGILQIMSRCPSGHPNVVKTEPRLDDGTPFPTMFYLTCPRLAGEIGTLKAFHTAGFLGTEHGPFLIVDPQDAAAAVRRRG